MHDDKLVRILITTAPAVGHLLPLLPLAREGRARGHEIVVAGGASIASIIAGAGFRHEVMGPATIREMFAGLPDMSAVPARERVLVTMPHVFARGIAPAMADGVEELVERWRPDAIIHEDMELGAWAVAEREGIPHVTVQTTAWRPWIRVLGWEALEPLRVRYGLTGSDPDQSWGRAFFTTRPPSLRDPEAPLPEVTAELRPIADDRGAGDHAPAEGTFPPRDGGPRVVVTLGTINHTQVDVLRALIDGAVAMGAHVVVGLGTDPASLGEVPAGVDVRAYIPMSTVLPDADIVAHHGGSGTMLAALAAGTPMLIVPLAADQPDNGDRCEAAGVARIVSPDAIDAGTVRSALEAALAHPSYRRRSAEVAAEVAAMPGPDVALDRIESIVAKAAGEPR
jgi:UDP:flavonoid glycosyltransferase YjiC (YdhE family)